MKSINKKSYINISIILSFIIIAVLEIFAIWPHHILNGNDFYFHLERLEELIKTNSLLPMFSFNSFSNNGSAVMTMYPYLLLYPFAILIKLIGHAKYVIYLMYILNVFITLLISYFSSLQLTSKRSISYTFAFIYSISFEYLAINFWSCDMGVAWSATFMPLILFGYIYWIRNNKWLILSIGVSLLIYSNVTISIITLGLLIIWTLFNYKILDKVHLILLTKAAILTLLTTAVFWLPALKLMILNPNFIGPVNIHEKVGEVRPQAILATFIPTYSFKFHGWWPWELTIPSALGFIVATFRFKHLNRVLRQFYIVSLCILILASCPIIWKLPIIFRLGASIQQTIRMYLIPQVLLSYIFTIYSFKVLDRVNNHKLYKSLILIICICLLQVTYIGIFHEQQSTSNIHRNGIVNMSRILTSKTNPSYQDYYIGTHRTANIITKDNGIINGTQITHFKKNDNRHLMIKTSKAIQSLSLPILKYNGINYKCYLDGRRMNLYSSKDLITLRNISKGTHNITIATTLTKTAYTAYMLSIISIFIYIILLIKHIYIKVQ